MQNLKTPAQKKKTEIIPTVIETKRLFLKELTPEIFNELFTTYNDEQIIDLLGISGSEELAVEKNKWQQGMTTYRISFKLFLMADKETGNIIGRCGFHNWYAEHKRAEIGYIMANDTVKGKGYMTEAVKAIIAYGFEKMALNRIEAFIGPNNIPSLKLIRGRGFTEEGTLRSHFYKNGRYEDSVCFSLLKSEYDKANK